MSERLVLAPLKEAHWTVTALGDLLEDILARAAADDAQWQGIAYTTAGARSLRSVSEERLTATDRVEGSDEVASENVYELRLWAVDGLPVGVLAKELRWVNGVGSVEVEVRTAAHAETPPTERCWYRDNSYLKHGTSTPYTDASEITSIEIFIQEPEYGNVVFADEIMTGRWN